MTVRNERGQELLDSVAHRLVTQPTISTVGRKGTLHGGAVWGSPPPCILSKRITSHEFCTDGAVRHKSDAEGGQAAGGLCVKRARKRTEKVGTC